MSENTIQIKLANYKGIQVKKQEITVTEQEIEAELKHAQERAAKTEEKVNGAAAIGDETVIDFIGYIDGEAFPGGEGSDYPLTLGSGAFIPGFEEQLVGAKKGDQVDVKVTFPTNYHAPEFAGKEAVFKVTVKIIRTSVIPELSDDVITQVSGCKTVAEFVDYVKTTIRRYKEEHAAIEKENQVLEQIVEASEIVVPKEKVTERMNALKDNLLAQLRNNGNTFEEYLQYNGLTEEQFQKYAENDALTMLKGQAVLQEIANREGFSYTQEELKKEIAEMAHSYQLEEAQLRQMMGEKGVAMVGEDILAKKALNFICGQAVEIE